MRKTILFIIAILLLTAACTPSPSEPKATSDGAEEISITEEEKEAANLQNLDTSYKQKIFTATLQNLFDKAVKQQKYCAYYKRGAEYTAQDRICYVAGGTYDIKLIHVEVQEWDKDSWYNVVYINSATEEAVGYCEDLRTSRCTDVDTAFAADIDDLNIVLPTEWIKRITSAEEIGSQQFDDKNVLIIKTKLDDRIDATMYIDRYSGLPLRVEQGKGVWEYTELILAVKEPMEHHASDQNAPLR